MLILLSQGHYQLFFFILFALTFSLTFHEFGHAFVAKKFGDNTAEQMGRLTLNPIAHIDPMGLLMVIVIGFGYAKPVPTNPRNFTSHWADLWVSAAGPGMNFLIAFVVINFYALSLSMGWSLFSDASSFFIYLALINLVLMIFNLIPIGPLDGHYILPYFLPKNLAYKYVVFNQKYGSFFLLALVALSFMGIPIFSYVFGFGKALLPFITVIPM